MSDLTGVELRLHPAVSEKDDDYITHTWPMWLIKGWLVSDLSEEVLRPQSAASGRLHDPSLVNLAN